MATTSPPATTPTAAQRTVNLVLIVVSAIMGVCAAGLTITGKGNAATSIAGIAMVLVLVTQVAIRRGWNRPPATEQR